MLIGFPPYPVHPGQGTVDCICPFVLAVFDVECVSGWTVASRIEIAGLKLKGLLDSVLLHGNMLTGHRISALSIFIHTAGQKKPVAYCQVAKCNSQSNQSYQSCRQWRERNRDG